MYKAKPGDGIQVAPSTDDASEHLMFYGSPLLSADTVRLPDQLGGRIVLVLGPATQCACGGNHVAVELAAFSNGRRVCVSDCEGEFLWYTRRGGEE